MFEEEIIEQGIINSVKNGKAEIQLISSGQCDNCTAKIICNKGDTGKRNLILDNNFQGKEGDKVRISVKGKNILEATFLLYGLPVFLIIIGVIIGMQIFRDELLSAFLGFSITGIFFLCMFFFYRNKRNKDIIQAEII